MKKKSRVTQTILNLTFIIFCSMIAIPFVMLVSASLSSEQDIIDYGYAIFPRSISFEAYKYVFKNPKSILDAYKTTITFSVTQTFLSVLLSAMFAYPLSKPHLRGKKYLNFYLYFTALFSGGLVPSYILQTRYLHLNDTIWVYIIPGLIGSYHVFMMRTFFKEIPYEITESMMMDGASEYTIFFRSIVPLSKPVLATVALLKFLGNWNSWYTTMLYIDNAELYSLQYLLQKILRDIAFLQEHADLSMSMIMDLMDVPTETVRMAMAIVVAGPALVIFPFFQKYFVKGMTVGAVKG
ncbi:MAG: carbohydrate ABC transporter permease [Lachnospiraceae bacterium]|nr:carbohydrate ABC transporter permease [Lachnospiraceae bacterium]